MSLGVGIVGATQTISSQKPDDFSGGSVKRESSKTKRRLKKKKPGNPLL